MFFHTHKLLCEFTRNNFCFTPCNFFSHHQNFIHRVYGALFLSGGRPQLPPPRRRLAAALRARGRYVTTQDCCLAARGFDSRGRVEVKVYKINDLFAICICMGSQTCHPALSSVLPSFNPKSVCMSIFFVCHA
jgi:hypothetical protein